MNTLLDNVQRVAERVNFDRRLAKLRVESVAFTPHLLLRERVVDDHLRQPPKNQKLNTHIKIAEQWTHYTAIV